MPNDYALRIGVPASDPPATLAVVDFAGDSFTDGDPGPTDDAHRFSSVTVGLLEGELDTTITEANHGVGGARQHLAVDCILRQVYQLPDRVTKGLTATAPGTAPYAPFGECLVIQASINNLNSTPMVADMSIITRCLSEAIRFYRSGGVYPALGPTFDYPAGTWTSEVETDANYATGVKRCSANGAQWRNITRSDFPGGDHYVTGPRATGFGAVHTVTLNGSPYGTFDTRGGTAINGSDVWVIKLTGLNPGVNTILGTISSIATVENINGAHFEVPGTKPLVIVLNTARSSNYPGGGTTTTDTIVNNSNSAVVSMLDTDYPDDDRVVLVDIDAILGKNDANFFTDKTHPNDTGAGLIASTGVVPAILAAL